ncbi:hypothetical protein C9374_013256 [Naegleria lovaniensis]|uniref:Dynamin stalk domain-containing protein n=1 Tax=Naegleria lovaniensis TaxID=51637 RepID=A0AA88H082_NAELO|nr:uncharacterized protein C9374_013256 [Naegleria lovaniensis]KAG2391771.1 hypothetical protein C9374_013256 [Naegleria lovaniensis]
MKKLTTVSDHFKGRKALIKKLTDIQNDHLKSSLPDLREKLKIELKKVNEEIENFSANVTAYLEGEESLVSLFEDNAKKIVKEFERVATHQGACINEEQSEDEVFKKLNHDDDNESNKVFSLPDFSKSMENMKNSIMQASEIQLDDDKCYLELAMNMLEKQRGFPGLPDLYQPTILIELTKLKLSSMQKSVTTTSEEVLQEWKSLVLDSIIPKSVKQVVDKDSTTDMLQHHLSTLLDKQIEKAIKLIEHYFNIERHRTTTLNSNYEHHQKTLAKYANELRNPTRDAKQVQEHGLPKADQTFIDTACQKDVATTRQSSYSFCSYGSIDQI